MIKHLVASAMFIVFSGCQYVTKHEGKQTSADLELSQLREKYAAIYSEVEASLDPDTGWPSINDCDSTLFAGLACSVGLPVKIELAEYTPGEIHRRPGRACWTPEQGDVGSRSTISRDMLTGYMACLVHRKDLPALQRLADYGEKSDWIMGQPAHLVSRVLLTGNGIGILGRAIYELSNGSDDRYYRRTGYLFPSVQLDFEKHLQVQGILLQDRIDDSYNLTRINSEMLDRLIENAAAMPNDALFSAALGRFTGDQAGTLEILLRDQNECPTYARGEKPEVYCKLNWLQAAKIVFNE